jgi:hypothetical protein
MNNFARHYGVPARNRAKAEIHANVVQWTVSPPPTAQHHVQFFQQPAPQAIAVPPGNLTPINPFDVSAMPPFSRECSFGSRSFSDFLSCES